MILLDSTVEIGIVAMFHVRAQYFPDGTRIGAMSIAGYLLRTFAGHGKSTPKEFLGRRIPCRTEHGINEVAILIDGAV